jgi:hypothetical protein
MPVPRAKKRVRHQRHEIRYARHRQCCPEVRHNSDHPAREAEGSQRLIYGTVGGAAARSDNVAEPCVSRGRDFSLPKQWVAIPNRADEAVAKQSL